MKSENTKLQYELSMKNAELVQFKEEVRRLKDESLWSRGYTDFHIFMQRRNNFITETNAMVSFMMHHAIIRLFIMMDVGARGNGAPFFAS